MTDRPVKQINAFTTQATPANGDFLLLQEAAGGLYKKTTLQNVIATVGIVVDLAPVLGGNLDTNNKEISNSGGDVTVNDNLIILNGDILLDNDQIIHFEDSGGTPRSVFQLSSGDIVFMGFLNIGVDVDVLIRSGDDISFGVNGKSGSFTTAMILYDDADISIGTSSSAAQLHIEQPNSVGAQPVLLLSQLDISEEMIEFNTTIGVGNAIEAVGAKALTTTHFVKVTIPGGLTRYFEIGTIA